MDWTVQKPADASFLRVLAVDAVLLELRNVAVRGISLLGLHVLGVLLHLGGFDGHFRRGGHLCLCVLCVCWACGARRCGGGVLVPARPRSWRACVTRAVRGAQRAARARTAAGAFRGVRRCGARCAYAPVRGCACADVRGRRSGAVSRRACAAPPRRAGRAAVSCGRSSRFYAFSGGDLGGGALSSFTRYRSPSFSL